MRSSAAENFAGCIIWEKADSPRNSARQFSTDHDCILVYGKREDWTPFKLVPRTSASDSIYTNPDNDSRGPWLPGDPYANKPYSRGLYTVTGPTGRQFQPPAGRYWRLSIEKLRALDHDGRVWWGPNGSARPSIKRYLSEVADLVPRTLWSRHDVGSNRTSKNEMRALFADQATFATPKPERLMQRIIQISTQPGDIVLDCFAGSGTTAAVAHKMGRGWVIAEWSAETVANFTLPRLTRVVAGEDPGGITSVDTPTGADLPDGVKPGSAKAAASVLDALAKAGQLDELELIDSAGISELVQALRAADKTSRETIWSGGGGFKVADVGQSMFEVVDGRVYLADWASNGALAQAVGAQLGYDFEVDEPFSWH